MSPTDTQILDWIELHPEYDIGHYSSANGCWWVILDSKEMTEHTERLSKARTLREAVTNAIQHPYDIRLY